jgi:hypothetical protein
MDLFHTLPDLHAWGDCLVAQTGLRLDLRSAQGKSIASPMAAHAHNEGWFGPQSRAVDWRSRIGGFVQPDS